MNYVLLTHACVNLIPKVDFCSIADHRIPILFFFIHYSGSFSSQSEGLDLNLLPLESQCRYLVIREIQYNQIDLYIKNIDIIHCMEINNCMYLSAFILGTRKSLVQKLEFF